MFNWRRALSFGSRFVRSDKEQYAFESVFQHKPKSKSTNVYMENFMFSPKLTQQEQEKILHTLNTSQPDQLLRLQVSKTRVRNLENWRNRRGHFKKLSDLLEVEGIGVSALEKLCNKILGDIEDPHTKLIHKGLRSLVVPALTHLEVESINSAVGLHLDTIGVSWAKLSQENNAVSDWDFYDFEALPKKTSPMDLFQLAVCVLNAIPAADAYVLEAPNNLQNQKHSAAIVAHAQKLELSSMLIALINTSRVHNPPDEEAKSQANMQLYTNRVYYLKQYLPARLFKTLVGNERVSNSATVEKLLAPAKNNPLPCTPISVKTCLRNKYSGFSPINRHLLGQALLLTITFMDTCVYKNSGSLAVLVPNKNNEKF